MTRYELAGICSRIKTVTPTEPEAEALLNTYILIRCVSCSSDVSFFLFFTGRMVNDGIFRPIGNVGPIWHVGVGSVKDATLYKCKKL